ncbi:hypothetical protein KAR91_56405 [Candidatus Pacearchaeota archaeon]|nr:hypothetical protein [Candidatus Pacearchaeota archaeon]
MDYANPTVAAIVVEDFDYEVGRRILIARIQGLPDNQLGYLYIQTSLSPAVEFGDKIRFNMETGEAYLSRGNSLLTFKLTTYSLQASLLLTLILNQPSKTR